MCITNELLTAPPHLTCPPNWVRIIRCIKASYFGGALNRKQEEGKKKSVWFASLCNSKLVFLSLSVPLFCIHPTERRLAFTKEVLRPWRLYRKASSGAGLPFSRIVAELLTSKVPLSLIIYLFIYLSTFILKAVWRLIKKHGLLAQLHLSKSDGTFIWRFFWQQEGCLSCRYQGFWQFL